MEEKLKKRLQQLQEEFNKGQLRLKELEEESMQVRNTLLRISGAIQVLEETLKEEDETVNGSLSMTAHKAENQ